MLNNPFPQSLSEQGDYIEELQALLTELETIDSHTDRFITKQSTADVLFNTDGSLKPIGTEFHLYDNNTPEQIFVIAPDTTSPRIPFHRDRTNYLPVATGEKDVILIDRDGDELTFLGYDIFNSEVFNSTLSAGDEIKHWCVADLSTKKYWVVTQNSGDSGWGYVLRQITLTYPGTITFESPIYPFPGDSLDPDQRTRSGDDGHPFMDMIGNGVWFNSTRSDQYANFVKPISDYVSTLFADSPSTGATVTYESIPTIFGSHRIRWVSGTDTDAKIYLGDNSGVIGADSILIDESTTYTLVLWATEVAGGAASQTYAVRAVNTEGGGASFSYSQPMSVYINAVPQFFTFTTNAGSNVVQFEIERTGTTANVTVDIQAILLFIGSPPAAASINLFPLLKDTPAAGISSATVSFRPNDESTLTFGEYLIDVNTSPNTYSGLLLPALPTVPVKPSTQYTATFWIKGISNYEGERMMAEIRDNTFVRIAVKYGIYPTADFQKVFLTFTTTASNTAVQIRMIKENSPSLFVYAVTSPVLTETSFDVNSYIIPFSYSPLINQIYYVDTSGNNLSKLLNTQFDCAQPAARVVNGAVDRVFFKMTFNGVSYLASASNVINSDFTLHEDISSWLEFRYNKSVDKVYYTKSISTVDGDQVRSFSATINPDGSLSNHEQLLEYEPTPKNVIDNRDWAALHFGDGDDDNIILSSDENRLFYRHNSDIISGLSINAIALNNTDTCGMPYPLHERVSKYRDIHHLRSLSLNEVAPEIQFTFNADEIKHFSYLFVFGQAIVDSEPNNVYKMLVNFLDDTDTQTYYTYRIGSEPSATIPSHTGAFEISVTQNSDDNNAVGKFQFFVFPDNKAIGSAGFFRLAGTSDTHVYAETIATLTDAITKTSPPHRLSFTIDGGHNFSTDTKIEVFGTRGGKMWGLPDVV